MIGIKAKTLIGIATVINFSSYSKKKLMLKATIMVIIDRKSVPKPINNFLGNDFKKSC